MIYILFAVLVLMWPAIYIFNELRTYKEGGDCFGWTCKLSCWLAKHNVPGFDKLCRRPAQKTSKPVV